MSRNPLDPFGVSSIDRWMDDIQRTSRLQNNLGYVQSLVDAVPDWARSAGSLASDLTDTALRPKLFDGVPDFAKQLTSLGIDNKHRFSAISYAEQALRKAGMIDVPDFSRLADSLPIREMTRMQNLIDSMTSLGGVGKMMAPQESLWSDSRTLRAVLDVVPKDTLRLIEQITGTMKAFSPPSIREPVLRIIEGIDFDSIHAAISRASDRIAAVSEDRGEPASFDELHETVDQVHLEEITQAIVEAVTVSIRDAYQQRRVRGEPSQWTIFFLSTVIALICTAFQFVGSQPVFQRWLEKKMLPESVQKAAPAVPALDAGLTIKGPSTYTSRAPVKGDETILVSRTSVDLRAGPHTRQRILATVPQSQLLRQRKTKENWVLVEYIDPRGDGASVTGWIKKKYTASVEAETRRIIWCALTTELRPDDGCDE